MMLTVNNVTANRTTAETQAIRNTWLPKSMAPSECTKESLHRQAAGRFDLNQRAKIGS